jgi:hypothetical protein
MGHAGSGPVDQVAFAARIAARTFLFKRAGTLKRKEAFSMAAAKP